MKMRRATRQNRVFDWMNKRSIESRKIIVGISMGTIKLLKSRGFSNTNIVSSLTTKSGGSLIITIK